jgi:hypothetical protein
MFHAAIAAIDQNREELILRPASQEIARAKSIPHGLSNHAQDGIAGLVAVGCSEVLQPVYLNGDDAEWKVVARKTGEILAQVESGELVIGDAGGLVYAAMRGQSVIVPIRREFCSSKLYTTPMIERWESRMGAIRIST